MILRRRVASILTFSFFMLVASVPCAFAQVSAAISGMVTDASGAAVSGATVTAKNLETAAVRTTSTDGAGRYRLLGLPVGACEETVAKDGFQTIVRDGIHLVVGQEARLDFSLQVGEIRQQITVNEDVPPVNPTTTDISGLVGEQQVKDLPLNGRSYDLLMLLNPGVVNFTWEKTGGIGISNSTTANMFSVSGNRPQQNLFLLNGVEFTGAAENNMTPGGASGQLLGIDAVREFNLLRDTYSAEYGKKPGGQVSIVTQSGTNQFHGSIFEFLRNNDLDARNYFDAGPSAPPFQRNQFGASAGGPVQKDKTFIFGNYEGFRQNLHETSVAFVPDAQATADASAYRQEHGPAEPVACGPGGRSRFQGRQACGWSRRKYSAVLCRRFAKTSERCALIMCFPSRDSVDAVYTVDDSYSNTATPLDPYSTDLLSLREQVLSLQETHVLLADAAQHRSHWFLSRGIFLCRRTYAGYSGRHRAGLLGGAPVGAVVVGGSQASNPQAQLGLAGSNNGSNLHIARNLFTFTDDVALTKGRHQFHAGVWFQPFQSNEDNRTQPIRAADFYRPANFSERHC